MSDEARRRLARDPDPGAAEVLRKARALERAGLRDEALDALLLARHDPEVRREIGRWPAWNGGMGAVVETSASLDVRPVRSAPTVRWRGRAIHGAAWSASYQPFLVSALGLVAPVAPGRIGVFDLTTGDVRVELPIPRPVSVSGAIHGDVLLLNHAPGERLHLYAYDLSTGDLLWDTDSIEPCWIAPETPLLIEGDDDSLWVHDLSDPRQPPGAAWRVRGTGHVGSLAATASEIFVVMDRGLLVVDRRSGVELHRMMDAVLRRVHGDLVLLEKPGREGLAACDRSGLVRWTTDGEPVAMGREAVLVTRGRMYGPRELLALARDSGEAFASLSRDFEPYRPSALAREVFYGCMEGALAAVTLDGSQLWEVSLSELGGAPEAVAPVHGGLIVLGDDGTLTYLEADS